MGPSLEVHGRNLGLRTATRSMWGTFFSSSVGTWTREALVMPVSSLPWAALHRYEPDEVCGRGGDTHAVGSGCLSAVEEHAWCEMKRTRLIGADGGLGQPEVSVEEVARQLKAGALHLLGEA